MATDLPPPEPLDLTAELARIDREQARLHAERARLTVAVRHPDTAIWKIFLASGVFGAFFFAAGAAFEFFVLR